MAEEQPFKKKQTPKHNNKLKPERWVFICSHVVRKEQTVTTALVTARWSSDNMEFSVMAKFSQFHTILFSYTLTGIKIPLF